MLLFFTAIASLLFLAYAVLIFFYQRRWAAIPYFIPGRETAQPGAFTAETLTAERLTAEKLSGKRGSGETGSGERLTVEKLGAETGSGETLTGEPLAGEPHGSRMTRITVLIPARNEEAGILDCLQSLAQQTYPKDRFEVLVLDDHSTDGTAAVVDAFVGSGADGLALRCLRIAEMPLPPGLTAYKKFAIETGVAAASGELIVTTDADCFFDARWLSTLAAFYEEKGARFIAAPVRIETAPRSAENAMRPPGNAIRPAAPGTGGPHSLLRIFQTLDFITLQGITGAAVHSNFHSMCNGANLAYARDAFYEVGGFQGIDHIPSGDDMLLMHKIYLLNPGKVFFLKSRHAIVSTRPMMRWKGFINQRVRWASKADSYDDRSIFRALLLVYLANVLFLVLGVAALFNYWWLWLLLVLLVVKTIVEYPFVRSVASFFGQQRLMVYFPLLQPLHIVYTVLIGWLGKFGSYSWKDRTIKK